MISVIKTYDSDVAVKLGGCDSCGCHKDLATVSLYRYAGEEWNTTGIVLCRKCMEAAIRTMHAAASDDKFWEDEREDMEEPTRKKLQDYTSGIVAKE